MAVEVVEREAREITIPLGEYIELVRTAERVAVIERLCASNNYVSTEDLKSALKIK